MKNSMQNFGEFTLTRSEMKSVVGGGCQVCSSGTKGGTCGGATLSESEAQALVNELNAMNDGYTYFRTCPEG